MTESTVSFNVYACADTHDVAHKLRGGKGKGSMNKKEMIENYIWALTGFDVVTINQGFYMRIATFTMRRKEWCTDDWGEEEDA